VVEALLAFGAERVEVTYGRGHFDGRLSE